MAESPFVEFFRQLAKQHEEQERDRAEMYLQAGRAIVTLSEIEAWMAEIFVYLSDPMDEGAASNMFYETQNFGHKIKLVDYAIRTGADAKTKATWPKLSARILKQHIVRTVAAHASVQFTQRQEDKKFVISLGPQSRDKKSKKHPEYKIEDLRKAANELHEIQRSMQRLFVQTVQAREKALLDLS